MLCKFIEITLWDGCSPLNLLHIFRTLLPKNTSRGLFLTYDFSSSSSAKKELLKVSVVKSVLGFCYILSVVFTAFTILLLPSTSSSSKRKSNLLPATTIWYYIKMISVVIWIMLWGLIQTLFKRGLNNLIDQQYIKV